MTPIDPKFKSAPRPGFKGQLNFDNKNRSANPEIFNTVRGIVSGVNGMSGAGGEQAQKLYKNNTYLESRAYTDAKERDAAQFRVEKQFTDQLNSRYGETAAAMNMSVPTFLQSQGIHGISEIGEGADRRMTAYKKDSFRRITYNPLMSSNDRSNKAMVKGAGYNYENFGANENRIGTAIVPQAIGKEVEDRSRKLALDLETGLTNLGDLEGSFLTRAEKTHVKNKKKTIENTVTAGTIYSEDPALVERVRSEMIKTNQMDKLKKTVRKDLQGEGLIEPDKEQKPKKEKSIATKVFEGMMLTVSKVLGTLGDLKSLFGSAVAYLQSIADTVGNIIKNTGAAGLSYKNAAKLAAYSKRNAAVYGGGDTNVGFTSAKAWVNNAGDIRRAGKSAFDGMGMHGYESLIPVILEQSQKKNIDPEGAMRVIYGNLAQRVVAAGGKDKNEQAMINELTRQGTFVGEAAPGFLDLYMTMMQKRMTLGTLTKDNAKNLYRDEMATVSGKEGSDPINSTYSLALGIGAGTPYGERGDVGEVGKLTEAIEAFKIVLRKFATVNLDKIEALLGQIAIGILSFAAYFETDENGVIHQMNNAAKIVSLSKGEESFAESKTSLAQMRSFARKVAVSKGETAEHADYAWEHFKTPEEWSTWKSDIFSGSLGKQLLDAVVKRPEVEKDINKYLKGDKSYPGSGKLSAYLRRAQHGMVKYRKKYGLGRPVDGEQIDLLKVTPDRDLLEKVEETETVPAQRKKGSFGETWIEPEHKKLKGALQGMLDPLQRNFMPSIASASSRGSSSALGGDQQKQQSIDTYQIYVDLAVNGQTVLSQRDLTKDKKITAFHAGSINLV